MTVMTSKRLEIQPILTYRMVTSKCRSDGAEGAVVYGAEVIRSGNYNDYAVIEDLSSNRNEAEEFIFRLKKGQVTPDQLLYVAEDFLEEINMR